MPTFKVSPAATKASHSRQSLAIDVDSGGVELKVLFCVPVTPTTADVSHWWVPVGSESRQKRADMICGISMATVESDPNKSRSSDSSFRLIVHCRYWADGTMVSKSWNGHLCCTVEYKVERTTSWQHSIRTDTVTTTKGYSLQIVEDG